jgi:uncharacterized protein (TIRG00374 family)
MVRSSVVRGGRSVATVRQWGVRIFKYGIGILALGWILRQITLGQVVTLLRGIESATLLAVVAVTGVGLAARFYTWHVLCNRFRRTEFAAAASTDLIVNFVNQLLPSRLSGRAIAPFVVREESGMTYSGAVAVAGVHTGLYAVLYGAVSVVGFVLAYRQFPPALALMLLFSTVLYVGAGAVVLFAGTRLDSMDTLITRLAAIERVPMIGTRLAGLVEKLPAFAGASAESFDELASDPAIVIRYAAGWVGAMVLAPGLRVWLLLTSLGISFEPALLLPIYLVMAYSVTLLPLTPGGIGVTEATATAVFVALGVPSSVIVPVVFVDRFLGVYLPALVGWYPSLRMDFSALATE